MKAIGSLVALLALSAPTIASPIQRRALTDADILNYALTLEHLEDTFYRQGLANYTQEDFAKAGFDKTFYENLKEVAYDESTHVKFITDALKAAGAPAVKECKYAFGVTTPAAFVTLATVLEGVGVSAYLGAAASIMSKTYLTAAGSILTSEARHTSYLRAGNKERPYPQPFDVPLDFNEVYTLASPFFVECPKDNPPLPVKAFPGLSVAKSDKIVTGSKITLTAAKAVSGNSKDKSSAIYAAFILVTGPVWVPVTSKGDGKSYEVTVPPNVHGQSYVVLTNCNQNVSDDTVVAGPAIVEIMGTDGAPELI